MEVINNIEYLTTEELSKQAGCSIQTIKRKIKSGVIKPSLKKGRANLFSTDTVEILKNLVKYNKANNTASGMDNAEKFEFQKNRLEEYYGYQPYIFNIKPEDFVDVHTKISVTCKKCNTTFEVSFININNNMRNNKEPYCKICSINRQKELFSKKLDDYLNDLNVLFNNNHNYEIVGNFINMDTPVEHHCLICGDNFTTTPSNVKYAIKNKGIRYCPTCNNLKRDNRPYEEKLKEINPNIIPLEEYKGRKVPIKHKCLLCNHEWSCAPDNRLKGEGCPKCSNKITQSKTEIEILNYIKDICKDKYTIKEKDRTILKGKELDIYIEGLNVAFEINGNYWHSEKYKGKKYHLEKTNECLNKGITLYHIFDDEWNEKQNIVKSKIKYLLKINNDLTKIYARNCYVKEINNSKIKNEFLNRNHIQGEDRCSISLGLYTKKDNKLVSVMTFCNPRCSLGQTKETKYDGELSRFASDINYIVVGAFSKIWKYFEKEYEWNKIITYADKRWSNGNLYIKNGWTHLHDSKPNYWYVNKNTKQKYHRYNFRKQVLKTKFPNIYNESLTEFQIMDKTEYFRVWDCGNMVFEITKN